MSLNLHWWISIVVAFLLEYGIGRVVAGSAAVTSLASFSGSTGTSPNGAKPYAGVLIAPDGTLYGTTHQGGTYGFPLGHGTIFKVSSAGVTTTLFSFNGANGAQPYAGLSFGDDGNLYGTTLIGGASNLGTVFRITTNGDLTTLLSFTKVNGAKPAGRLTFGGDGNFYGTTQKGGDHDLGTVFQVRTNGEIYSLFSFDGTNGSSPYAEVAIGEDGHLYGTTVTGGAANLGSVFQLTTNGSFTSIFSFSGTNGAKPFGGLVLDPSGVFYGVTAYGGANDAGTIFKITTNGVLTIIRELNGAKDGANPWSTLLRGQDGSYYGTTILGGAAQNIPRGTLLQFTTNGAFAVLVSFGYDRNGSSPYCSLAQDAVGNLYGTTFDQGVGLKGTVFRLNPAGAKLRSVVAGNGFEVSWDAWIGKSYQLEYKTNATQTGWSDLSAPVLATNGLMTIRDPLQNVGRLYRLRQITP